MYFTVTCNSKTHTKYIVVFPLQQWLRELAATLRYTYIVFLVTICTNNQHTRPGTGRCNCRKFKNFLHWHCILARSRLRCSVISEWKVQRCTKRHTVFSFWRLSVPCPSHAINLAAGNVADLQRTTNSTGTTVKTSFFKYTQKIGTVAKNDFPACCRIK